MSYIKDLVRDAIASAKALPAMIPAVGSIGAAIGVTPVGWAIIGVGTVLVGGAIAYTMWNDAEDDHVEKGKAAKDIEEAQREADREFHPEMFTPRDKKCDGDEHIIWDRNLNLALHPDFLAEGATTVNFEVVHSIMNYLGGVSNLKFIEIMRDDKGYVDDKLAFHLHNPIPINRPMGGGRFLYEDKNRRSDCPCAILLANDFIYPTSVIKAMIGVYVGMVRNMEEVPWEECLGEHPQQNVHVKMDL